MKAIVHLPISKSTKLLVDVGEKITSNTTIAEEAVREKEEIISVAKILHVKPVNISKYFKKRVGEYIKKGEVLAEKKSLFSSCVLKSPISAKLAGMDLKKGTLTLLRDLKDCARKVTSPFPGKVKSITKTYIEVEMEGEVYNAYKGGGREAVGKLYYLESDKLSVLDITLDVDGCIIACRSITEAALVKLEVLGAVGLILLKLPQEYTSITWVQVSEEVFKKLSLQVDKSIWLRPSQRQIVAC